MAYELRRDVNIRELFEKWLVGSNLVNKHEPSEDTPRNLNCEDLVVPDMPLDLST